MTLEQTLSEAVARRFPWWLKAAHAMGFWCALTVATTLCMWHTHNDTCNILTRVKTLLLTASYVKTILLLLLLLLQYVTSNKRRRHHHHHHCVACPLADVAVPTRTLKWTLALCPMNNDNNNNNKHTNNNNNNNDRLTAFDPGQPG